MEGEGRISCLVDPLLFCSRHQGSREVPQAPEVDSNFACLPTAGSEGSVSEPQCLPLSNRANTICLIQMGIKSGEGMGVRGKVLGSRRRPGPGLRSHLWVEEDTELRRGTVTCHCHKGTHGAQA